MVALGQKSSWFSRQKRPQASDLFHDSYAEAPLAAEMDNGRGLRWLADAWSRDLYRGVLVRGDLQQDS